MSKQKQTYATTRLGAGDMVLVRESHPVTVSVDKESFAYRAQVIYSESDAPSLHAESEWFAISTLNTLDETDVAIPLTATAVACRVTEISGETIPRRGARMEVTSSEGKDLAGFNHRKRPNSGKQYPDFAVNPPAAFLPPFVPGTPLPPNPLHWFDMDDATTVWQDTAGTILGVPGASTIARLDNKGSDGTPLLQATPADRPAYLAQAIGGRHALESAAQAKPDGQFLTANPAAGININVTGFTQALVVRRRLPTGGAIRQMSGWAGVIFDTSAFGTLRFEYAPNSTDSFPAGGSVVDNWYLVYSVFQPPASGVQDKEKFQSGSAPLQRAITSVPTIIAGGAELRLGDNTFDGIDLEIAEWIIWPRDLTTQERLDLPAHMDEKYQAMPHDQEGPF